MPSLFQHSGAVNTAQSFQVCLLFCICLPMHQVHNPRLPRSSVSEPGHRATTSSSNTSAITHACLLAELDNLLAMVVKGCCKWQGLLLAGSHPNMLFTSSLAFWEASWSGLSLPPYKHSHSAAPHTHSTHVKASAGTFSCIALYAVMLSSIDSNTIYCKLVHSQAMPAKCMRAMAFCLSH